MIIFKKISFYLSLAGILLAITLVRTLQKPQPPQTMARFPAVNPYLKTIATSGIIESKDRNIAVSAPQSGLITAIYAKVSDEVLEGSPLFQIDPRELQAKILTQEAQVKVAEAHLVRLEDQLKRLQSVSDPRSVSQEDVKTRENDVKVAHLQLLHTQAQVEETRQLIRRLTVKAPRAGILLQNNIRLGEYFFVNSDKPAMLLGTNQQLQIRVDIDEQNASRFHPDYKAMAYLKNNTQYRFPITFELIEPFVIPKKSLTGASEEKADTRVLQVIYSFEKPKDINLYIGQQVDIFIEENPHE